MVVVLREESSAPLTYSANTTSRSFSREELASIRFAPENVDSIYHLQEVEGHYVVISNKGNTVMGIAHDEEEAKQRLHGESIKKAQGLAKQLREEVIDLT
jgi:hypothetical protein